ncbi:MAG TPA: ferrous iron transporter B [Candidatus Limnocylindrales bacterium]
MTCHDAPAPLTPGGLDAAEPPLPVVALVGRPNVGKSTLFAAASRRFAETTNAPGTTVGEEPRVVEAGGRRGVLVDLPGTLSLADRPTGDEPFWRTLLAAAPDAILLVADAGDLRRHLPLALACRDLGLPLVVAANLADEALSRGLRLDAGRLSQLLAGPVHLTVGREGRGVEAALADALRLAEQRRRVRDEAASPRGTVPARIYPPSVERELASAADRLEGLHSLGAAAADDLGLAAFVARSAVSPRGAATLEAAATLEPLRWDVAARWAGQVETWRAGRAAAGQAETRGPRPSVADRLGRWSTAPWPGIPLFVLVTAAAFAAMMVVGGVLSGLLAAAWGATASPTLTSLVHALVPWRPLAAALLWGLDGGVLAMLSVGIPYVLTFYVLLAVLEDSGYLTSAAVLTDRLLNTVGLPGRAAIPLLAATGCNVPAIYGTRVLQTRRERLLASFLVVLTPCSARSAVVVAALAPFAGPAVAVAAFLLIGLITLAAGVGANALVPGRQPALVLELAPLRRPVARLVARKAWLRFRSFVVTAAPVMLAGSIVLGFVYESGLIAPLAAALDPIVRGWLGLPAVAGLALAFAFLRKELALQLLVTLAVATYGAGAASLGAFLSPAQLFVYAVVASVSVPCVATLAALAGEFGWRMAGAISGATIVLALGTGGVLARLLGIA